MHNDFDADDLRIISHIAAGLNMSLVSKKLGITPQRVSQRISKMEQMCKTALVYKKGGLHLTEAGTKLLALAESVEREVKTFKKNLAELQSDHGQLRIIAITSIIIDHVPEVLKLVQKEYPHLRVKLMQGTADQIIKAVETGLADVGLIGMARQVEGLVFKPYARESLCILTDRQHPLADQDAINFIDAANFTFIELDTSNIMSMIMNAAEMRTRTILHRSIRVSCLEIAANYACNGYGIALTLSSIAHRFQEQGLGKAISLNDSWASVEIASCTKQVSRQTPALRYFLSELEKQFR
jgi:DNA-binding transcriptional LysR family regulator